MADERDGLQARMDRAERDVSDLADHVGENSIKLAAIPYIKETVRAIDKNCRETREWVEEQMRKAKREAEEKEAAERAEKRLSRGQFWMIVGVIAGLVATLFTAVAVLVAIL